MKKIFIFLLFCIFSFSVFSQKNTVYFSYHPAEKMTGMRYDIRFKQTGIYFSNSYIQQILLQNDEYIKNYNRFVFGFLGYEQYEEDGPIFAFGPGLVWNMYGESNIIENDFKLYPFSFEPNITVILQKRFAISFRWDMIKKDIYFIDIGLSFGKTR